MWPYLWTNNSDTQIMKLPYATVIVNYHDAQTQCHQMFITLEQIVSF